MAENSSNTPSRDKVIITERDIVFDCPTCQGVLVVDRDGEGMKLKCVHCGAPVLVPKQKTQVAEGARVVSTTPKPSQTTNPAQAPPRQKLSFDFSKLSLEDVEVRLGVLRLQLKENESQRVETRGHLNRTMLQLHRHQMQMERLVSRQNEIEEEIAALEGHARGLK